MTRTKQLLTRRYFFGKASAGLGIAALSGLLDRICEADGNGDCPACRTSRRRRSASFTCSNRARPSQMDLFDYKPRLKDLARHGTAGLGPDGPAADRHDVRPDSFPVAPSVFSFAQHGASAPGSAS